jgi:hypothetical protein
MKAEEDRGRTEGGPRETEEGTRKEEGLGRNEGRIKGSRGITRRKLEWNEGEEGEKEGRRRRKHTCLSL